MKLDYAHLADMAINSDAGKLSIIGLFDRILCATPPTPENPTVRPTMAIIVGFVFEPDDLGKDVELMIELIDPDAKQLVAAIGTISVGDDTDLRIRNVMHFTFDLVKFERLGLHEISVKINGHEVKPLPILVELLKP